MITIFRKLIEAGVDKKDLEILKELSVEKEFLNKEYEEIATKVKLSVDEVKKRVNVLKNKKILLKDRVSIIDQVRVWDGYYIVLIKATIQPPVIGMETKFPTGWVVKDYIEGMREAEKEMGIDLIRHAYNLQGSEWDLLLIVSAKSQKEYVEFMGKLAKQGWVSKGWSMTPVELGDEWIFDPISTPEPSKIKEIDRSVLVDKDE